MSKECGKRRMKRGAKAGGELKSASEASKQHEAFTNVCGVVSHCRVDILY